MSSEHLGRSHGRRSPCCPCAAVAPAPPLCLAPQTSRGYHVWSCNFNFVGNTNGKGCVAGALLRGAGPKGIWFKCLLRTRSFRLSAASCAASHLNTRLSESLAASSYLYQAVGHMFNCVVPSHWWRSPKVQSRDVHQMSLSRQPIYLKGTSDAKLADATLLTEHSSKNDSLQTSRVSQYIVSCSIGVLPCIMLYACHEWILCRICAPNALRTSVFVWFVYGHGCLCPKAPRRYMSQGLAQSSRINDVRSNSPNPSVAPTMDRWQLYAQHLTSPKHLWEVIQLVLQDVASRRLEHCKR